MTTRTAKGGSASSPCRTRPSSTSCSTPPPIAPSSRDSALAEVFCNQCGHRNPGNSNFCSSCGAPLDVRGDEHTITLTTTEDAADVAGDVSIDVDDIPAGAGVLLVKR